MHEPTISPFGKPVSKLPLDQQITFYERLAHELTIAVRGIWSDDTLAAGEKVDRMKWINEIMHRIPNKLAQLRHASHHWDDQDFEAMVAHWTLQNPSLVKVVNRAINASFRLTTGNF